MRTFKIVAILSISLLGCGRCGKTPRPPPATLIASDASIAAIVPNIGVFAARAAALSDALKTTPAGEQFAAWHTDVTQQLGFDPLAAPGWAQAGVDATGGLAVSIESPGGARPRGGGYVALPVLDEKRAGEFVERLARERAGLITTAVSERNGIKVHTLARGASLPPLFAYTFMHGYLIASALAGCDEMVALAASRRDDQSLARSPRWQQVTARLGDRDLVVLAPPSPLVAIKGIDWPPLLAVGLSLANNEMSLRVFVQTSEQEAAGAALFMPGGGADLLAHLPSGAPLYLRTGLDLAKLTGHADAWYLPVVGALLGRLRTLTTEGGFDFDAALSNVQPGAVMSLALQSDAPIADCLDANFDPARTNLFRAVRLAGLMRVKDPTRVEKLLAQAETLLPRIGSRAVKSTVRGVSVTTVHYALGDGLSWSQKGDLLAVAGGGVDPAQLLESAAGPTRATFPAASATALFGTAGVALSLDFPAFAHAVSALPSSAYGSGPTSFMMRSTIGVVIQPLATWRAALALAPAPGGLALDLALSPVVATGVAK